MIEPGLVLAFFPDIVAAEDALNRARRGGFSRVALISKTTVGKLEVSQRELSDGQGAALGVMAGAALLAAFPALRVARSVPLLAGAATGFGLARAFDQAVSEDVLERYKNTLTNGEVLVIVEAPMVRLSGALRILREDETARPTTFVARPSHLRQEDDSNHGARLREVETLERLAQTARELAGRHQPRKSRAYNPVLLYRLRSNARVIDAVHDNLVEAARLDQPVSLSAEWLLDNSYIIQGQIVEVKRSLSRAFYRELPVVETAPIDKSRSAVRAGSTPEANVIVPRVYALARELVTRAGNRLDDANIRAFVSAYQEIAPLSIAELWALPLMLRLALIENLRRLFVQTDRRQRDQERADFWANRLLNATRREPDMVLHFLSALSAEQVDVHSHFADRLVSLLYDESAVLTHVRSWLERKLDAPFADIVAREQSRQAADQIAVSNAIGSQRFLNQLDWSEVFEELSQVEAELKNDPSGVYRNMDFATRDYYRRQVERIARKSPLGEREVAALAVAQAVGQGSGVAEEENNNALSPLPRFSSDPQLQKHIGFHLIDDGQRAFEHSAQYSAPLALRARRAALEKPLPVYLGAMGAITLGGATVLTVVAKRSGARWPGVLGLLALLPASEVGTQFVNYLATRLVPPKPLPKMDFENGIPPAWSTLVVVPMMLDSVEGILENLSNLEVHYLANSDARLKFALLSDYTDADSQRKPEDETLLQTAVSGIAELNAQYSGNGDLGLEAGNGNQNQPPTSSLQPRFFLFHRDRRWCESENSWMGWERKRGKLEQLNAWLLDESGHHADELHAVNCERDAMGDIRFVITLDADAQLPHDSARRLVETIAHPLNAAVSPSPKVRERGLGSEGLPTRGYGVIIPRVATTLPSATATRFSRLFTEVSGTDPYTHVVSDVYQDLFGESSYQGKGIYDVEVFHRALDRRFPESHILSHDLIEGAHVRVGLASDIEILDQFPPNYETYVRREHRWIRGDWQISDWILNEVPTASGTEANPLSLLNRWKIADNLRRSLVAPATFALLLRAWSGTPGLAVAGSTLAAVNRLAPTILQLSHFVSSGSKNLADVRDVAHTLERCVVQTALLPHQAQLSLDAIIRAIYRQRVSKKLLLEWQTASASYRSAQERERGFMLRLSAGGAVAVGLGVLLLRRPLVLRAAAPYLALWSAAPLLVKWLATPTRRELAGELSESDTHYLRRIGRRTWRYFDDFVGPQTNWLPPDNYQETLNVEIAQRTSPTNIGLWLQSVLVAFDFGYIPADEAVNRALQTLRTFADLEKFNGHLLNWYNVQTLESLPPRYVSTVDSGNLLGSLMTLQHGVEEMLDAPIADEKSLCGLTDTLAVLREVMPSNSSAMPEIDALQELFSGLQDSAPMGVAQCLRAALPGVEQLLILVVEEAKAAQQAGSTPSRRTLATRPTDIEQAIFDPRIDVAENVYWATQLDQMLRAWIHNLDRYTRWMETLAAPSDAWFHPLGDDARACRSEALQAAPSLSQMSRGEVPALNALLEMRTRRGLPPALSSWLENLSEEFSQARWLAGEMVGDAMELLDRTRKTVDEMDMAFLFDKKRKLFPVGFSVDEMRADASFYDLLASECRLASFLAIARGQAPVEHWWNLGRRYGRGENGSAVLLSWSGTMFEFLMPTLYLRGHQQALLDTACHAAIREQMRYAWRKNIPWGISEAAYSDLDANRVYQYKAFGVPSLGLQRGHDNDLVVAPYATLMALPIATRDAIENLKRLQSLGAYGSYGFYESVDFSRQRLLGDEVETSSGEETAENPSSIVPHSTLSDRGVVVRAFMAHHQGMAFLALDNLLHRRYDGGEEIGAMQARLHADPLVRAATPLLYEGVPHSPAVLDSIGEEAPPERLSQSSSTAAGAFSRFHSPDSLVPRTHLLSNGSYAIMLTNAGGGYSHWSRKKSDGSETTYDVSRWRADTTKDSYGSFIYVRDIETSATWSVTHQPLRRPARAAGVEFKPERVEYKRRDAEIETVTDVFVAPEDNCEIRRVTLVNHSSRPREVEVTSYVEIALNEHAADRAHPAFSKLFVQTESLLERGALLANRRPRDEADPQLWALHMVTEAGGLGLEAGNGNNHHSRLQCETDRALFIGRNRTVADPIALRQPLSGTVGAVLDPIFSLRRRIVIAPNQRVQISFLTGAGNSREEMLHQVEKYCEAGAVDRELELAWVHAQLEMHHLRVRADETQLFQQLAAGVLYPHVSFRAPAARLRENTRGQSALWSYGISGDLPIFSVIVDHERDLPAVRQALMAHSFWRLHGLKADLVILNQQAGGYHQELTEKLKSVASPFEQYVGMDKSSGIFIRARETMPEEDLTLILAAAHVVMVASRGRLAQQLSTLPGAPPHAPRLVIAQRPDEEPSAPLPFLKLPYFNGLGGFTTDGREYCVYLGPGAHTPAPWINVMANPTFGQMVSESGNGFAWWGNSQANRMTDWSNDPVSDPINDAIYIRDDDTGVSWTPTANPIRERDAYRARHGQGYTVFEHNSHAIEQEIMMFVPLASNGEMEPGDKVSSPHNRATSPPLRAQRLRLKNTSSRRRRLTITGYHEWVLGTVKEQTQLHVVTSWDTQSRTLLAHNAYHPDYSSRVAFSTSSPPPEYFTADRTAFLGRNGKLSSPGVLRREHLTDRVGAGLDPCAATQFHVELAPGETTEITFLMGECENIENVRALVEKFRDPAEVEKSLQETKVAWDEILSALEVSTPIESINFLLNRWLLYQNLSCRVWGRSAFYQSGGAWGFRDQLQDVMALVYTMPEIVRAQIVRAAAHQFEEGDVQHWWHEPSGAGVRTRITDDLLFLPYVASHYIRVTGDESVLDEEVHFLSAPPLAEGEDEKYFAPGVTDYKATIYEHCQRAIEKGCTSGAHNLPLIGTGDWNDGMNRVGEHGKGESVWLAWFAIDVLRGFAETIATRDKAAAKKMRARATRYAKAVEENGWDGEWYRRGYYDDGTPLGSSESEEGKIDVLPQAWAAISGAGDAERTTQALASADKILVKPEEKMILLFTPPFDKTEKNPGYIKGYLPGVRENGGQYTHGALWLTLAHAQRGEGDRAVELLQLLNPVEHARNEAQASLYKVEPYVVAADVYSLKGQEGRGGWTWYTGSAGWMYRVWVESVLGFQPRADKLFIRPAIPKDWKEYTLKYRHGNSVYEIKVENPNGENGGVGEIKMEGKILSKKVNGEFFIPLKDDGKTHSVIVRLGEAGSTPSVPPISKAIVKAPDKSKDETDAPTLEANP